ncbi:hypothetical protein JW964_11325 [candidate division KSB1 bacterium]|nr:hypothetical protein [candidate division KSB1 bacterium]
MLVKSFARACLLCCFSIVSVSHGGLFFSVQPSFTSISGAQFGIRAGRFTPYIGFGFLSLSGNMSYEYEEEIWDGTEYIYQTTTGEYKAKANLFIPSLGLRFSLRDGDLVPYLCGSAFYVIPHMEFKEDGEPILTDDERREIRSLISTVGIYLGFGSEYCFSEHFSIGGEFGINFLANKAKAENLLDGDAFAAIGMTRALLSVNFYY